MLFSLMAWHLLSSRTLPRMPPIALSVSAGCGGSQSIYNGSKEHYKNPGYPFWRGGVSVIHLIFVFYVLLFTNGSAPEGHTPSEFLKLFAKLQGWKLASFHNYTGRPGTFTQKIIWLIPTTQNTYGTPAPPNDISYILFLSLPNPRDA
jgi:hypothetical protein